MKKLIVFVAIFALLFVGADFAEAQGKAKLNKQLKFGMSDENVKLLQEVLATDPDVYPEGLVTGYFGTLTEKAVRKFQAKQGLESVGVVGPKTTARINELLTVGAGNSGKVPAGLLIAPGIAKKIASTTVRAPLPGQVLPPGIAKKLNQSTSTSTDTGAPVISSLSATSTATTTVVVSWKTNESATGKLWWATTSPLTTDAHMMSNDVLKRNHSFTISDLSASTTVYYIAVSADKTGNTATSTEQSIKTREE